MPKCLRCGNICSERNRLTLDTGAKMTIKYFLCDLCVEAFIDASIVKLGDKTYIERRELDNFGGEKNGRK